MDSRRLSAKERRASERRAKATVPHASERGATFASERLYENGALAQLRAGAPAVSAVDKDIVRDSFGLEAAVALGYPPEQRPDEAGEALVPCNRLGCWFPFDDLQAAAQRQLAGEVAELKGQLEDVLAKKLREEVRPADRRAPELRTAAESRATSVLANPHLHADR